MFSLILEELLRQYALNGLAGFVRSALFYAKNLVEIRKLFQIVEGDILVERAR